MTDPKSFPAGWYPHPETNIVTWFDGTRYTDQVRPTPPANLNVEAGNAGTDAVVHPVTVAPQAGAATFPPGWYLDSNGRRERWWNGEKFTSDIRPLQRQAYAQPVVLVQKGTSHGFHLIMSIITVGLWIPVWIIVTISNASARR